MTEHDALSYLIHWLRTKPRSDYASYGYDLYIPNVIRAYLAQQNPKAQRSELEQLYHNRGREISPLLYAAAWELCRRGIIRPGVRILGAQATDEGSGGNGYSVTPFGQAWLKESDADDFVPTEPERFGGMLVSFRDHFGEGFHERGQQAIRCYGAHAYLACCAMCGAAAESIILATAIAKKGDEEAVLKAYVSANGRGRVEKIVVGQAPGYLKREFLGLTGLLKYWRDEAAHGKASKIGDNEAYTSLAMLLRLAQLVHDNWADLTRSAA